MLEVLVVVACLVLLSGMLLPALARARMKAQAHGCLNNLKYLGTAATMYEYDNAGKMLYAALHLRPGVEMSWDDLIDPYMGGTLTREERWASPYSGRKGMPYLKCPSDHAPAIAQSGLGSLTSRRSYAMPHFIYRPESGMWPPSIQSRTGVGFSWSFDDDGTPDDMTCYTWNSVDRPDGDGSKERPYPRKQWAMRSNLVLQQNETILLTEQIRSENLMGGAANAVIDHAAQHCETGTVKLGGGRVYNYAPASSHHDSAFNYLMVDGHAELLEPEQTIRHGTALNSQSKMWTIRAGD
ncbi:MAG: hypothetical protein HYZ36_00130 [Pedosphaera parvula]|nr:hypothetical protein [Pedosphaera parvula]